MSEASTLAASLSLEKKRALVFKFRRATGVVTGRRRMGTALRAFKKEMSVWSTCQRDCELLSIWEAEGLFICSSPRRGLA